jgi:ATP-grasp domain, R2K clade family 3
MDPACGAVIVWIWKLVGRHHPGVMLLLPADVLRPRRPDSHFADEAGAARDAGLDVALVDHDALSTGGAAVRAVASVPERATGSVAVYRGWMLRSERYAELARALAHRRITLRTSPDQYRAAHELPGWYAALADVTPASAWTVGDGIDDFRRACAELGRGPAVLRDYTKSMKHYWHEAAFIPDVADTAGGWAVASRFRQLRVDDFAGGFVLRRFERFVSAEARTWWVDGICRLVGPHPDTPHDDPPADLDLTAIAPLVGALRLPFVTVDLARRDDGAWRVIEVGDGQVSDRATTIRPEGLVAVIAGIRPTQSG